MEELKERIQQNFEPILDGFNKVLESYSLSGIKGVKFKIGRKDALTKPTSQSILNDLNTVLIQKNIQDAYVIEFTLAEDSGREGLCKIEIRGMSIYIKCSN